MKKKKTRFTNGLHSLGKAFLLILLLGGFCQQVSSQTVSITSSDTNAAEVDGNTNGGASFTISRAPNNLTTNTVTYSVGGGTATSGDDFQPLTGGSVTLNALFPSVTVDVNIAQDQLVEGTETIIITLTNGDGAIIGPQNSVTLNIGDDDTGTFTLTMTEGAAAEEGTVRGRYIIALDKENGTGQAVTILTPLQVRRPTQKIIPLGGAGSTLFSGGGDHTKGFKY